MAIIETTYYNPRGDKSLGCSYPKEDLRKFFFDTIKEMEAGEECSRESLLIAYRNAGGKKEEEKIYFLIDLKLTIHSLMSVDAWSNGMVSKMLIGPNEKGGYIRR